VSDAFESVVPEAHYKSEVSRLSADIHKQDKTIRNLKKTLIKLKIEINNVQFFEPDDYDLGNIIKRIEKALEVK
jgi:hypothetical protein